MKKKEIKIGTFNLNNLFGRFNFEASIEKIAPLGVYSFNEKDKCWIKKPSGRLMKAKSKAEREKLAKIILNSGVEILAVQEVEDRKTLKKFNSEYLRRRYKYQVVIDGNDPRYIDVGLLSMYPLGAVTSWQHYSDPESPDKLIFSRDLLQVEILSRDSRNLLFTLFVSHLKSNFFSPWLQGLEKEEQMKKNNHKRLRQSKAVVDIVSQQMGQNNRYIIAGDFNDTPDSKYLAPLLENKLELENIVGRLPKSEQWTYIYKGKEQQLDYILAPPLMSKKIKEVKIGECKLKGRATMPMCGSDHRPVFAVLDL